MTHEKHKIKSLRPDLGGDGKVTSLSGQQVLVLWSLSLPETGIGS